jgi:hypothetical protein
MAIARLQQFLISLDSKPASGRVRFWFCLSLAFSVLYGFLGLREGFGSEYVVQDDARQHVFWMLRFLDSELFPNDLIADYFQSVAPGGYKAIYQLPAALGINPLWLNKLLPMVLGIVTSCYCFGVSMQLLPIPATGFMATLLLNQAIWMKDDLVSGTPRAFLYPFFMGFLYYLLRRNLVGVGVAIALLGVFYPQYTFVAVVMLVLRVVDWENQRLGLSQNRSDLLLCATGLGVAFFVLLPYALSSSQFGPTITAAAARQLPDFLPGGRTQFFHENPWHFWINGRRSGFFPRYFFAPATLWLGLLLPIFMRFSDKFTLAKQVKNGVLLLQILLASLVMFFIAHATIFKLHVPSRYTGYNLRIIMSFAGAIALTILIDKILTSAKEDPFFLLPLSIVSQLCMGMLVILIFYPTFVSNFPETNYRVGKTPVLYEYFQKQPKDSLIASLAEEANNLPSFCQRSILTGRKYAVPYQVGYYNEFRQRTSDLIRAQYSPKLKDVKDFIKKYGVDFWLLERTAFTTDYVANDEWLAQYQPATKETIEKLKQGAIPALSKFTNRCQVLELDNLVVLEAKCIAKTAQN